MSIVDLDQDYHVHSLFSNDAHSSPEENLAEAEWMGLRTLCLVDHVRSSSTHVPDLVAMVRALRPRSGIEILCGVEAKLLDRSGALDLPPHAGVDHVMIADHQFPSEQGPVTAAEVRERLARGLLRADPHRQNRHIEKMDNQRFAVRLGEDARPHQLNFKVAHADSTITMQP